MIGRKFSDPQVQREKGQLPYEVVEGPDGSTGIRVSHPMIIPDTFNILC